MAKRTNLQVKYPYLEPEKREETAVEIDEVIPIIDAEEKPTIVFREPPRYNKAINNTILIRSRLDAKYKTTGSVSGRPYVFNGAGSIVDVDKRDVDEFLSRRRRKGCCGGSSPNSLFELV